MIVVGGDGGRGAAAVMDQIDVSMAMEVMDPVNISIAMAARDEDSSW